MSRLRNELRYLPAVNAIPFPKHHLLNRNISEIIETNHCFEKNSTFLIMSPSCEVCHEKLETIIKSKKHKKGNILFYADAVNEKKYVEMVAKFIEVRIHPLSLEQIQNLNKGMFPLFIDVTPQGTIIKVYLK